MLDQKVCSSLGGVLDNACQAMVLPINQASDTLLLIVVAGAGSHRPQGHTQMSITGTFWLHVVAEGSIQLSPIVANKLTGQAGSQVSSSA